MDFRFELFVVVSVGGIIDGGAESGGVTGVFEGDTFPFPFPFVLVVFVLRASEDGRGIDLDF